MEIRGIQKPLEPGRSIENSAAETIETLPWTSDRCIAYDTACESGRFVKQAQIGKAAQFGESAAKPKPGACHGIDCQKGDILTRDDPGNACLHQHLFKPAPI